jgi:hypothetical protein
MVHTLKRVYLYTAATFALLFTAGVTIILLDTLLNLAGLLPHEINGDGSIGFTASPPDSQQVVQSVVLFVVTAVLVGGLFGGGHYWLIRRDARSDPGADAGPVRQVFLNGLMALAVLIGVPTALTALSNVDQTPGFYDTAISLSFALVAALVFVFVFLERRRVNPAGRAAPLIRQIQEEGVQAILLVIASFVLFSAITSVIHWAFVTSNVVAQQECFFQSFDSPASGSFAPCPAPPLLSPILTALFAIAAWAGYVWLGLWSRGAVLYRILCYLALAYGLVWLLYGVAQAIYTATAPLFGDANAWQESLNGSLAFVGELLTGALIVLPYLRFIRRVAAQAPDRRQAIQQGLLAIPAALSLGFFLAGLILLLRGLVEQFAPAGSPLDADGWATALGVLVAGLAYPAVWLRLRRESDPSQEGPVIPRRIYVLVVLAGTAIGALIAAVFMVYQIVASVLGLESASPLLARQSAVVLLVLGAAALYHLWLLRADLRASHARAAAAQPAPVPVSAGAPAQPATLAELAETPTGAPETLEGILQHVAAGSLDPASAAARIRSLPKL